MCRDAGANSWGHRQRYADHLVLALHVQAAMFLWVTLFFALKRIEEDVATAVLIAALCWTIWIAWRTRCAHRGLSFVSRLLPTVLLYALALIFVVGGLALLSFLLG